MYYVNNNIKYLSLDVSKSDVTSKQLLNVITYLKKNNNLIIVFVLFCKLYNNINGD